jgi:protein-tyrosine phosphatase
MTDVLLLCTANICRSPMAAAALQLALRDPGAVRKNTSIRSAGMLASGVPPPSEVLIVMAGYGLDLSEHRSHQVSAADLDRADLILAMSRENLRHAVVLAPEAWPRAFTIRELVRRGGLAGPRLAGEPLAAWLARLHDGRSRLQLLGESLQDDVADPIGGPPAAYTQTAAELMQLTQQAARLCWPMSGWPGGR